MQQLMRKLQEKVESEKRTGDNEEPIEQRGLVYGKYANSPGRMSTEEDFKLAEYHFNEDDWK